MTFLFEPGARQDFTDAVRRYLHEAGPQRSQAFDNEVRRSLNLISQMPEIGAAAPLACRSWPLRRHPFTIVYRIESGIIRVIAISHQSREPGYWSERR